MKNLYSQPHNPLLIRFCGAKLFKTRRERYPRQKLLKFLLVPIKRSPLDFPPNNGEKAHTIHGSIPSFFFHLLLPFSLLAYPLQVTISLFHAITFNLRFFNGIFYFSSESLIFYKLRPLFVIQKEREREKGSGETGEESMRKKGQEGCFFIPAS